MKGRLQGYEQFETLIQNDPALAQDIANIIETRRSGSGPVGEQQGDYNEELPKPVLDELTQIKNRVAFVEQRSAEDEFRFRISNLLEKYPNANVDAVVQFSLDNNLGVDLETAYKAMSFDIAKREATDKGEKAGAEKLLKLMSEKNLTDLEIGKGSTPGLEGQQVTKEQQSYARMLGLTDEQYLEGMKSRAGTKGI